MHGCLNYREPLDAARRIYLGNGKSVGVKTLSFSFKYLLLFEFKDTSVVPSFIRNSVLISTMNKFDFFLFI